MFPCTVYSPAVPRFTNPFLFITFDRQTQVVGLHRRFTREVPFEFGAGNRCRAIQIEYSSFFYVYFIFLPNRLLFLFLAINTRRIAGLTKRGCLLAIVGGSSRYGRTVVTNRNLLLGEKEKKSRCSDITNLSFHRCTHNLFPYDEWNSGIRIEDS